QQQAGGHPYQYTTTFVLNYNTASKKFLFGGSGGPRELQVELPPGFIGNPQNTPRCPLVLLRSGCPSDTAVGYTIASLGGELSGGNARILVPGSNSEKESLLWNLAPAP